MHHFVQLAFVVTFCNNIVNRLYDMFVLKLYNVHFNTASPLHEISSKNNSAEFVLKCTSI